MTSWGLLGPSAMVGLLGGVLLLVMFLGVVGLFVVIAVSSRSEPDATGRRPHAIYLFSVSFLTLWMALLGSVTIVTSLVELLGSHPQTFAGTVIRTSLHPIGDASARGVVLGVIVMLVSLAVLYVHLSKGKELARSKGGVTSAVHRIVQTYVAAVAFVSVVLIVVSVITALYGVFQILGPGVFGGAGRVPALRQLLDSCYLAIAGGVILWWHLSLADPPLWPRRRDEVLADS